MTGVAERAPTTGPAAPPAGRAPRSPGKGPVNLVLWGLTSLALLVLVVPGVFVVVASVGEGRFVVFPPRGFTLQWYSAVDSLLLSSAAFSLRLAALTTLISLVLGTMGAMAIVRCRLPGGNILEAIARSPVQVPTIVLGVAFLQYFALLRHTLGLPLLGTFAGLLVAHCIIAVPYVVTTVGAMLAMMEARLEEAAYGLGCGPVRTFFLITLPTVKPAIFSGAFFAFLISFEDVALAIFLTSPGRTTLPVQMFFLAEFASTPALYAMASILIAASTVAVLLFNRFVGVEGALYAGTR